MVPFVREPGERPSASALARRQALSGVLVTNRRHESFDLARFDRQLLALLDGQRRRSELADALDALVAEGTLTIQRTDAGPRDAAARRAIIVDSLENGLSRLASRAFLMS
jgi:hypothetical protein